MVESSTSERISKGGDDWPLVDQIQLFSAICSHKPVGVNRHFQMVCIHSLMLENGHKDLTTDQLWAYLARLYEMQALHESEILPFPNKECDFFLPEGDFGQLLHAKEEEINNSGGTQTPTSASLPQPSLTSHKDRKISTSSGDTQNSSRPSSPKPSTTPVVTSGRKSNRN